MIDESCVFRRIGAGTEPSRTIATSVARRLREVLDPAGMTLFQANGPAGWQDVFHFHIHLVPRWTGDRLTKPWASTPGDQRALDALAARFHGDP